MSTREKKTILLVSAGFHGVPSISALLKSAGYAVLRAKTVKKAVEILEGARTINLLLTDLDLFRSSGGSLSADAPFGDRNIPIVFLCSRDTGDLFKAGIPAAYGFVEKESGKGLLLASLETALRLHAGTGGPPIRPGAIEPPSKGRKPAAGTTSPVRDFTRLSGELYGSLLDSTTDLVFIKDDRLRYLMLNRANREFLNRTEGEILGKTDFDLMSESAAAHCLHTDRQALRMNRLAISIEEVDGRVYESRKFPVSLAGGNPGVGGFIRDITEIRRAEERLLSSEKKLYLRNRIAQLFLTVPGDDLYDAILGIVREMLHSELAFFGHIDEEGRLVNLAMAGMNPASCDVPKSDRVFPHEAWKGLWGRALTEGRPLYQNDGLYAPPGHAPLANALCTPIMYGDRVIGNFTLANKPGGYDDRHLEDLEEMSRYISPLLFARMQYLRKEDERRIAEMKITRYSSDMAFLSRCAMGFVDLPVNVDIHEYIARCLHEILPTFKVLVNEFDPSGNSTVIRALAGEEGVLDSVIQLLGRSPLGLRTTMPVEHRQALLGQQVRIAPGGTHELSGGTLPMTACMEIDRLLDIGTIYGMGFARHETLYGNVLLIAPRGMTLDNTSIVEAFVKQASIALQRHRAERALEWSLREKELLLRELQHRVKNSLSMITSLINLEAGRSKNDEARSCLKNIHNRVNTLSRLYTLLYQSQGGDEIHIDTYLEQIGRSLLATHLEAGRSIDIDFALDRVCVDFKRAASIGIVLNELVTNALKHAFPEGRSGRLRIRLARTENGLLLEVADNGIGPPEDFDIAASKGLGIELARVLARQLQGGLEYARGVETVFTIKMPYP